MFRLLLLFILVLPFAHGGDWPQFRGPNQSAHVPAPDAFSKGFGLAVAWQHPLGPGYSSVSIASGIAVAFYGGESSDFAEAFNAEDGSKRWTYKISPAYKGVAGSFDGPGSTPLIDGDRVYGIGARGELFALNLQTGKELYRFDLKTLGAPEPYYGFCSSLMVADDILVVPVGGEDAKAGFLGLNKISGKQVWASTSLVTDYQTANLLTLFGQRQLVVNCKERMVAINPQTGALLWENTESKGGGHIALVSENRLHVQPLNFGKNSMLLELSQKAEAKHFEQVWESREIGKSMGFAIYRDGYLYGYNRKFLACVDAKTGERMWKSRPPGAGFLIMVEDHLAVVTQEGSLHLIEASPDGYKEKSSLKVFDTTVHNPPAYANGKIYIRSMSAIAAISVGDHAEQVTSSKGSLPQTRFAKTMAEIAAAPKPNEAAKDFMAQQKSFPIIEDDRFVHIVYRGPAKDVVVNIQALDTDAEYALNRVGETDLHYFSFELPPTAQISYALGLDEEPLTADPLNPRTTDNFRSNKKLSILTMPGFKDSDHLSAVSNQGTIEDGEFESKHTGRERKFKVYLPHNYQQSEARYPVLYVGYGFSVLKNGQFAKSLDNLIQNKKIQDVIVVFVPPQPNINREGGLQEGKNLAAMFAEELVPLIDKKYRTRAESSARGLLGHLRMGFAFLYTAFNNTDTFGMVVTQSASVEPEFAADLMVAVEKARGKQTRVLLEWGVFDQKNEIRRDVIARNKQWLKTLKDKGIKVEGNELVLADGWAHWATRHDDILLWLFPR